MRRGNTQRDKTREKRANNICSCVCVGAGIRREQKKCVSVSDKKSRQGLSTTRLLSYTNANNT